MAGVVGVMGSASHCLRRWRRWRRPWRQRRRRLLWRRLNELGGVRCALRLFVYACELLCVCVWALCVAAAAEWAMVLERVYQGCCVAAVDWSGEKESACVCFQEMSASL